MNLPELKIGNLIAKIPIVQGGMGVGISLSSLAGSVAAQGGIGVISGVEIGFNEPDYHKNKKQANIRALKHHIQKEREKCKEGIIGVNIMTALNNFEEMVKESVNAKVDIIFAGAGLPLKLPKYTKGSNTKIAPIVSSGRTAEILCKSWDKHYHVIPDAIVVEGPKAGGHLGFSKDTLNLPKNHLNYLLSDVLSVIKPYEIKYNKKIPIIAAGGIFDGKDIADLMKIGASGVQLGTRFVATYECDASEEFKKTYINANKDDIKIIQSPVGMIGRAIGNDFLEEAKSGSKKPTECFINCLKPCNPSEAPYCIAQALINAQKGNMDCGFAFAGANVYKINKIQSVKELMTDLVEEAKIYFYSKK
ncbi:NAD(P)H-dependent flavin oxidoreductase [Garciella nitratireducens]|uniref:NAD(P)H-dependent flavin oxidoreductase n=1 Tax=Garciella nitratireducens TaxID=218205 RepID=UPI000DE90A43|nr:nitronate monooxygenase family protein [Garciella nitratireducens]RBP46820.1 NAD(P)H-dependent flavin oxidoreductase YrpB (nitropropane dioxygenase family) [Garciella nitratireducens]